jgi:hypothetical protein
MNNNNNNNTQKKGREKENFRQKIDVSNEAPKSNNSERNNKIRVK